MTIVSGDILRTTMNFVQTAGSLYQNIYHHERHGLGVITDAVHITAIASWATAMYGELEDVVNNTVVASLNSVDKVEFVAGRWQVVENIGTFTITFIPTAIANPIPYNVSAFVIFKTARPKSVGKKFLYSFTEGNIIGSIADAPLVAAIVAYADDAVNNFDVVFPLDFLEPGVVRTGFDEFLPFTVAVVTNLLGTQKRRRPGDGA